MTKTRMRKSLENNGYKVTLVMHRCYFATKGQQTYKADTITGLYKLIFKS
jgi:hypothetical protein